MLPTKCCASYINIKVLLWWQWCLKCCDFFCLHPHVSLRLLYRLTMLRCCSTTTTTAVASFFSNLSLSRAVKFMFFPWFPNTSLDQPCGYEQATQCFHLCSATPSTTFTSSTPFSFPSFLQIKYWINRTFGSQVFSRYVF